MLHEFPIWQRGAQAAKVSSLQLRQVFPSRGGESKHMNEEAIAESELPFQHAHSPICKQLNNSSDRHMHSSLRARPFSKFVQEAMHSCTNCQFWWKISPHGHLQSRRGGKHEWGFYSYGLQVILWVQIEKFLLPSFPYYTAWRVHRNYRPIFSAFWL